MSELFNVNTFIVSQVNPHVVPFVSVDGGGILESRMRKKLVSTLKNLFANEVKHVINQLDTMGIIPLQMRSLSFLISQAYKGHVTIVP
jgi:TAG lipase/steryl ester hydrolase/phospholipase A2/LPA acyltransferase